MEWFEKAKDDDTIQPEAKKCYDKCKDTAKKDPAINDWYLGLEICTKAEIAGKNSLTAPLKLEDGDATTGTATTAAATTAAETTAGGGRFLATATTGEDKTAKEVA